MTPRRPQDGPRIVKNQWFSLGFCTLALLDPFFHHQAPIISIFARKTTQDGPKRPQDRPTRLKDGPKTAQDGPKTTQDGPKTAPRRPQNRQKPMVFMSFWHIGALGPFLSSSRSILAPNTSQDSPKTTLRRPKTAQDGPKTTHDDPTTAPRRPKDDPRIVQNQ